MTTTDQHPADTAAADPAAVDRPTRRPELVDRRDRVPADARARRCTPPSRWRRGMLKVTAQGAPTTTRQAEVLNTAIIGSPTDERGRGGRHRHLSVVDGRARPVHRVRGQEDHLPERRASSGWSAPGSRR